MELSVSLKRPVTLGQHQVQEFRFSKPTVEGNLKLARSVAWSFLRSNRAVEDSFEYSDALVGLWRACENWTPAIALQRKCTFATYAIACMRNAILSGKRRRGTPKEQLLDFEARQPEAPTSHEAFVRDMFADHPSDTPKDRIAKTVLYEYYVLGRTLQEIGNSMSPQVSRNYVHQLCKRAIALLRKRFGKVRLAS